MFPQNRSQLFNLFCKLVYSFQYHENIGINTISASKFAKLDLRWADYKTDFMNI